MPLGLGVATQGSNRTRSLVWEDDAPAESRFRRVQQSAPGAVRGLPIDSKENDPPRGSPKPRFAAQRNPWWRPAGALGRGLLLFAVLVVFCAFAYALHICTSFLDHDSRFLLASPDDIEATGLSEVTRAEILPVFSSDIGRNIFFFPLAQRRKQLEQIPWVRQATVMRVLPDQIRISIIEREPVAFVRHGQQIGLVDANGVLLKMPPTLLTNHHYSFPVLTGIDEGDSLPSRKARVELYQRFVSELDSGSQHLSDQLSEIDLTDPEDARVLMPEQGFDVLAHFGQDHFIERFQRYKAHIAEWRRQYPRLAAVDLRYSQQVVLQMASGAATDQPALLTANSAKLPDAVKPAQQARTPEATPETSDSAAESSPAKPRVSAVAMSAPKKTAAKKKQERINELATRMRAKRAAAKRAALKQNQQKSSTKIHSTAASGQSQ